MRKVYFPKETKFLSGAKGFYFLFGAVIGILMITGGVLIFRNKKTFSVVPMNEQNLNGQVLSDKKIVMVIGFKDFRDEEYFVPKEILEKAGAEVETASNKIGEAMGTDGGQAPVDYLIEDVDLNNFDAVVFVGGPGCLVNLDNENSYNLIKQTVAKDKLLAAICVSPAILAKAGVLKGKQATVWSSSLDKSAVKILQDNGAIYKPENVVTDGKIITANGPDAAREFAEAIIKILK